jgi:integral membrane sensor domain MASE1
MENRRILGAKPSTVWKGALIGALCATAVTGGLILAGLLFPAATEVNAEAYALAEILVSLPGDGLLNRLGWARETRVWWLADSFYVLVNAILCAIPGAVVGWILSALVDCTRKAFHHE